MRAPLERHAEEREMITYTPQRRETLSLALTDHGRV